MSITLFTISISIALLFVTFIVCCFIFDDIAASVGAGLIVFFMSIAISLLTFNNFATELPVNSYELVSTDYISTVGSTYKYQPAQTYIYYLNEDNQIIGIPINDATIYYTDEESKVEVYGSKLWFLYNYEYIVYLKQN